jgi:hypothetical protein
LTGDGEGLQRYRKSNQSQNLREVKAPEFEKNCGSKKSKAYHTGKIKTLRKISTIKK